jgi:hypothetical protein
LRICTRAVLQDTAGHERFRTIATPYYRGAQGVILGTTFIPHAALPVSSQQLWLTADAGKPCARIYAHIYIVYDVSSRESFRAIPRWLEELEKRAQPDIVKILVGNKVDKVTGTCQFTSSRLCAPPRLPPDPSFLPRKTTARVC